MTRTPAFGAVVLAAGLSSRMGSFKPLLRVGSTSAIERVAGSLRSAGLTDIVVVSGHDRERLVPELRRLALREALNPLYRQGMFTSVQAGAGSLPTHVEAFMVLPVDYPLVSSRVISTLMKAYRGQDIVYPTCCGRRGHPPLISSRLRTDLSTAEEDSSLRAFLEAHAPASREVEVADISILLDMDTPGDHRRIAVFTAAMDAQAAGAAAGEPRLGDDDVRYLWSALQVEERVVRHCRAVAAVAETLAQAAAAAGVPVDPSTVRSAALLHDLAKGSRRHASEGRMVLERLGFPALGAMVGAHMVLPENETRGPDISGSQLVYLADKLVIEDEVAGLEAREQYALRTYSVDDVSAAVIKDRIDVARNIAARLETIVGRSLENISSSLGNPM